MTFFSTLKRWLGLQKTTDVSSTTETKPSLIFERGAYSPEKSGPTTPPVISAVEPIQPVIMQPVQTTASVVELSQPAPIQPGNEVKKATKPKNPKVAKEPMVATSTKPVKTVKETKSLSKKKAN
jgi:hypothetical protein